MSDLVNLLGREAFVVEDHPDNEGLYLISSPQFTGKFLKCKLEDMVAFYRAMYASFPESESFKNVCVALMKYRNAQLMLKSK